MTGARQGTTMVEVVVAMVLLSVILTALGGLTFTTARQMMKNTDASTLQAASLEAVNRFTTLPYATLSTAAGCDTTGTANNRFEQCVTVTPSGSRSTFVEIVTRPLQRVGVPSSTVRFTRAAPPGGNPLCLGC
jgi:prepilin-type N-terminal cleavage/methylation domain-containing protein